MTFDLSWALMRLRPRRKLGWPFFRSGVHTGKGRQPVVSDRGSPVLVLPREVFDLLTGGVSHRVPGETLFPCFHEASPEIAEGSLVQA